ncbi:MAG: penicillin-binding transpeptidase domain-containing protein [Alphaproteobacteria bacterium]
MQAFVYLAALDKGYTPSTLILDAPFVGVQGPGLPLWKPKNYTNKFYGPSTLRMGVEQSRNLMICVRLANEIGMDTVIDYANRLGIMKNMPPHLSMALGAGETTLLDLTAAYAMLVNGGKRITPTLIDRIQDRHGKTIQKHDTRVCEGCAQPWQDDLSAPELEDNREQVINPATAYQIVSILEGVVLRGTGAKVREVGKPLAGKTGTSNDSFDTWFMGFSPDLAVGVFVGFDTPATLGKTETGGSVASPIFRDFMIEALKDAPATPFRVPPGIRFVRINHLTGRLARSADKETILEAYKPGTEPTGDDDNTIVLDGSYIPGQASPAAAASGIY